jgi:hypothetical protein
MVYHDVKKVDAVRRFCATVSEGSTANLALLKAVDRTVDWLSSCQKEAEAYVDKARRFANVVKACDRASEIDANDEISGCIVAAEKSISDFVEYLKPKRRAAIVDPQLNGGHEEAVVGEYDRTVEVYCDLHDAMIELRWAIMEHDADLSKVSEDYADVEQLIADLDK